MKKMNVFAILLAGVVLAGCGSSEAAVMSTDYTSAAQRSNGAVAEAAVEYDYAESTADSAAEYYDGADLDEGYTVTEADAEAACGNDASTGSESGIKEVDTSKKIVYNLTYEVETMDLDALDAAIQAKVNALGGYIEYMSADGSANSDLYYGVESTNSTSRRYAYYTIRIPAAKLNEFAEAVEEGSNVTSRSKSTQDITSSYIDADSRRKSLEEELAVLDDMAEQATTVDELIQIEAQRTEVRADLENIASQLKSMDERVAYSTVDINVTEVKVLTDTTDKNLSWQERIANGFTTSCENLIETTQEILIWIASNLPMILFWIVMIVIILVLLRFVLWIAGAILGTNKNRKTRAGRKAEKAARKAEQASQSPAETTVAAAPADTTETAEEHKD